MLLASSGVSNSSRDPAPHMYALNDPNECLVRHPCCDENRLLTENLDKHVYRGSPVCFPDCGLLHC